MVDPIRRVAIVGTGLLGTSIALAATGERARARVPETRDHPTPMERLIALLAAEGLTREELGRERFYEGYRLQVCEVIPQD